MSARLALHIAAGLLFVGLGLFLVRSAPQAVATETFELNGCRLSVGILKPSGADARGAVVLLHGLSANRRLMDYFARGFLAVGLRVYVPDLPGHGASPGPFSFARAESCSEALVVELLRRNEIAAQRTILAGHSMGGAIALRVASRIPVAGVVALAPAPMGSSPSVSQEMVPYPGLPALPANSLIISAALEPASLRGAARLLAESLYDTGSGYHVIPFASHTSLLLDSAALRLSLDWAARLLFLPVSTTLPSRKPFLGFLAGLVGLALLMPPAIRAACKGAEHLERDEGSANSSFARLCAEMAIASILCILVLKLVVPLRFVRLYSGDYLASFLLLLGMALLGLRFSPVLKMFFAGLRSAGLALGIVTVLIFLAWLNVTLTTAWLDPSRLWRFPLLVAALLPFHAAEEISLGLPAEKTWLSHFLRSLALRSLAWFALAAGFFYLHSGQFLVVLLAPYFLLFSILQRLATYTVRRESRSLAAASLFGAILAAAFFLLVFPLS